MLAQIQVEGGGVAGRMAQRYTPSHVPAQMQQQQHHQQQQEPCCRRMQAWFTDLAVHNPGILPYNTRVGHHAVRMAGRLPDFREALPQHAKLRELLAEVPGKRHVVSIYTVSE